MKFKNGRLQLDVNTMKCEKCGKELSLINVNVFNYDGTDQFLSHSYNEYYKDAVVIDTTPNWTG